MRKLVIIGATISALVALSAVGASMATAAPEFKPAANSFTSTSGSGTLAASGGAIITCKEDTDSGKITGAKTAEVTIDFKKCTAFGIAKANSLGDPSETILTHATGLLCELSATEDGLILTPTAEVHIEAGGKLAIVKGSVIAKVEPVNKKSKEGKLILEQSSNGVQKIKECEGKKDHLETSEGEGAFKESSEATTDTETYEKEQEATT